MTMPADSSAATAPDDAPEPTERPVVTYPEALLAKVAERLREHATAVNDAARVMFDPARRNDEITEARAMWRVAAAIDAMLAAERAGR